MANTFASLNERQPITQPTRPKPGQHVQLKVHGEWLEQEYKVLDEQGRTPNHLVLQNPRNSVLFEQYWDEYPESCGVRLAIRPCEYGYDCQPAQYQIDNPAYGSMYYVCKACAHSVAIESATSTITPITELGGVEEWWND